MVRYRIHPSIGIARVGEDWDFFLGPELPGGPGLELADDGSTTPVARYKDASRTKVRKQGARFHLFQSEDDGATWTPAELPASATVTWSVRLVNQKAAVERPGDPPVAPTRPKVAAGRAGMRIDSGVVTITGRRATSPRLTGRFRSTTAAGAPYEREIELGELRTDAAGRLVVLGGNGWAGAPDGVELTGSYFRNPKWWDDVSDGPVTASVRLEGAEQPVEAEGGAWVVVAPPDYAPGVTCPVTLFDVLRQVGIEAGLPAPGVPSFDEDIAPLLARVRRLRFVHAEASWSDARLVDPRLRDPGQAHDSFRRTVRDELVLRVEQEFSGHTDPSGPRYRLRKFQRAQLDAWAAGDFRTTPSAPVGLTAEGLTRAALESTAGQGFCPGIEAGIVLLDPTLYLSPFDFRIDHTAVGAGDLTALMAQPWQADFVDCAETWWPTQRPDRAPQPGGTFRDWARGADEHALMIARSGRLGFVVQQGPDEVFFEVERNDAP